MSEFWVGGYGPDMGGSADGISVARSREDGSLELVSLASDLHSSYLVASGKHVYAAVEGRGEVASLRVEQGALVHDGTAASGGFAPCHLTVTGETLIAANYTSGSLGVVGLTDGAVDALVQQLEGVGSGPREQQDGPHAHASLVIDDDTVVSLDLGSDAVVVHRLEGGRLSPVSTVAFPPGSGPRDIVRLPSNLFLVLGELNGHVYLCEWVDGEFSIVESVAVPGAVEGDNGAGLSLGADARFAYVGLRGTNLISVVSIDGRSLAGVGSVSCGGNWPRHTTVDGDLLHVANQRSSTIASFRLGDDGMPTLIAEPTAAPTPTFLLRR